MAHNKYSVLICPFQVMEQQERIAVSEKYLKRFNPRGVVIEKFPNRNLATN